MRSVKLWSVPDPSRGRYCLTASGSFGQSQVEKTQSGLKNRGLGTFASETVLCRVSDNFHEVLRGRAKHCRHLAMGATDPVTKRLLETMAEDFDEEASHLESQHQMPPPLQE